MNAKAILLFMLFSLSCYFSFGKKKDKWIVVKGTVVDTIGIDIANERVALINQKGNDKKIVVSDDNGKFSFKVKKKNADKLFIKCYSNYVSSSKVKFNDFLNNNSNLVLNMDSNYRIGTLIDRGMIICHIPIQYEMAAIPRCGYILQKNYNIYPLLNSSLLPNGKLVIINNDF